MRSLLLSQLVRSMERFSPNIGFWTHTQEKVPVEKRTYLFFSCPSSEIVSQRRCIKEIGGRRQIAAYNKFRFFSLICACCSNMCTYIIPLKPDHFVFTHFPRTFNNSMSRVSDLSLGVEGEEGESMSKNKNKNERNLHPSENTSARLGPG